MLSNLWGHKLGRAVAASACALASTLKRILKMNQARYQKNQTSNDKNLHVLTVDASP